MYTSGFNHFLILCAVGLALAFIPMGVRHFLEKHTPKPVLNKDADKEDKKEAKDKWKEDITNKVESVAFLITCLMLLQFARFMYNVADDIFTIVRMYI